VFLYVFMGCVCVYGACMCLWGVYVFMGRVCVYGACMCLWGVHERPEEEDGTVEGRKEMQCRQRYFPT
jgi:hypothetical protein